VKGEQGYLSTVHHGERVYGANPTPFPKTIADALAKRFPDTVVVVPTEAELSEEDEQLMGAFEPIEKFLNL